MLKKTVGEILHDMDLCEIIDDEQLDDSIQKMTRILDDMNGAPLRFQFFTWEIRSKLDLLKDYKFWRRNNMKLFGGI